MSDLRSRLPYACPDALEWLGDRDAITAWRECHRADWMLWGALKIGIDRRLVTQMTCACARTVLHLVPDGEDRPRIAIETSEYAYAYAYAYADAYADHTKDREAHLLTMADLIRPMLTDAEIMEVLGDE